MRKSSQVYLEAGHIVGFSTLEDKRSTSYPRSFTKYFKYFRTTLLKIVCGHTGYNSIHVLMSGKIALNSSSTARSGSRKLGDCSCVDNDETPLAHREQCKTPPVEHM